MPGEIAYKLTADEAQALQAVSRLSREFGLNETAIKKAVEATKELDRTQQQMGREAQRIFDETRTPLEQQQIQMQKLDELYKANKIDAETYGRAVHQVQGSHQQAFGPEALSALKNFAAGFMPAISAAELLRHTLEEVAKLKSEAAQRDRSAEMSEGSLAEVAGGDPERFKALVNQSRGIAASAGMERNQAAALTFAAASAGALDQVGTFAQLKGQGIVNDPEQLMRATQTIQTAMGAGQTGDLRAITSRLLAAGEHSPQKIAQLGPAAALAGVNAQTAGVNVDELLAAVAVESKATGDASIAGTMQKSLQKTLSALKGGESAGSGYTQEQYDQEAKALAKAKLELQHEISADRAHMTASQRRAADPAKWDARRLVLKDAEQALRKKKATIEHGIQTDEEGHILDQKAQALRNDARSVLAKAGPGLMDQLHAIEAMKLDPQQMQKLFGRQEGLMAYQLLLRNEAEYKSAVGEVRAAPGKDLTGRVLALPQNDLRLAAAQQARVQTSAMEGAQAGMGTEENLYNAVRAVQDAAYGDSAWKVGAQRTAAWATTLLPGAHGRVLRDEATTGAGLNDTREHFQLWKKIVEQQGGYEAVKAQDKGGRFEERFAAAVEKFERAAGKIGGGRATLAAPNSDPGQPVGK
jgi:hypothetical protein